MFRKILVIFIFVVICTLFSGYFYCADRYAAQQAVPLSGDNIKVIITNSQSQNFISEGEVADMVRPAVKNMTVSRFPQVGETLRTEANLIQEVMNISLIECVIRVNEEVIATTTLKLATIDE